VTGDELAPAEDAIRRAERLLERLEAVRAELARVTESGDTDRAIELLGELQAIARETNAELERGRREAEAAGS
jgi:hypothetical protein